MNTSRIGGWLAVLSLLCLFLVAVFQGRTIEALERRVVVLESVQRKATDARQIIGCRGCDR